MVDELRERLERRVVGGEAARHQPVARPARAEVEAAEEQVLQRRHEEFAAEEVGRAQAVGVGAPREDGGLAGRGLRKGGARGARAQPRLKGRLHGREVAAEPRQAAAREVVGERPHGHPRWGRGPRGDEPVDDALLVARVRQVDHKVGGVDTGGDGDTRAAQVGLDAVTRPKVGDLARAHQEKRVEEGEDVGPRLVNGAEHRAAGVGEGAQLAHEQQRRVGIEPRRRLVQE